jgi:hypothetical protein
MHLVAAKLTSGFSSFKMPNLRLYSPAGLKHEPSGGAKIATERSRFVSRTVIFPSMV